MTSRVAGSMASYHMASSSSISSPSSSLPPLQARGSGPPSYVAGIPSPVGGRRRKRGAGIVEYVKRVFNFQHMDMEVALSTMFNLCFSPARVYRNIYYHKQTKNQWARDDPAFVVIQSLVLCATAVCYSIAYKLGFLGTLSLMLFMVVVDFLLVGTGVATFNWFFTNRLLLTRPLMHAVDQSVEWAYCFDVHCNAFFPTMLVTYIIQFFFLPIVTREGWIAAFVGDTMYAVAVGYYLYITFLGYNALPFLRHQTIFLYPIAILCLTWLLMLILGFNVSRFVLGVYFGT